MSENLKKLKLLLVDDELSIRMSAKLALDKYYDITTVSSTSEGLGLLKENHYDLVLLDIIIEGEGDDAGIEALKKINFQYPKLPVIILSGSLTWVQKWDQLRNYGAAGYLAKPFDKDKARELIERCIKGEKIDKVWS